MTCQVISSRTFNFPLTVSFFTAISDSSGVDSSLRVQVNSSGRGRGAMILSEVNANLRWRALSSLILEQFATQPDGPVVNSRSNVEFICQPAGSCLRSNIQIKGCQFESLPDQHCGF